MNHSDEAVKLTQFLSFISTLEKSYKKENPKENTTSTWRSNNAEQLRIFLGENPDIYKYWIEFIPYSLEDIAKMDPNKDKELLLALTERLKIIMVKVF